MSFDRRYVRDEWQEVVLLLWVTYLAILPILVRLPPVEEYLALDTGLRSINSSFNCIEKGRVPEPDPPITRHTVRSQYKKKLTEGSQKKKSLHQKINNSMIRLPCPGWT